MRAATAAAVCLLVVLAGAAPPVTAQALLLTEVRSALSAVASAASAATAAATGSLHGGAGEGLGSIREAATARRADRLAALEQTAQSTASLLEAAREARRAALEAGLGSLEAQTTGVRAAMRALVDAHVLRLQGLGAGLLGGATSGWPLGEPLSYHVPATMGALGDAGLTMHLPLSGGLAYWKEQALAFDDCVSQLHASLMPPHGLASLTAEERRELVTAWDRGLFECRNGLSLH